MGLELPGVARYVLVSGGGWRALRSRVREAVARWLGSADAAGCRSALFLAMRAYWACARSLDNSCSAGSSLIAGSQVY